MKSLAHPEWPYAGTQWEWRGFVKDEKKPFCARTDLHEVLDDLRCEIAVWTDVETEAAIYQKQNFGPKLD